MAVSTAHASGFGDLACRLAEAVGLKPSDTAGFTIQVLPDDIIRVRANQFVTEDGVKEVARIFEVAAADGSVPAASRRPFIPVARLEDLTLRAAAGTLTSAESLALAVLAGSGDGEGGVPALIDAAQEEWGHGSYRVPVRIVADRSRVRLLFTPPINADRLTPQGVTQLRDTARDWLSGKVMFLCMPPGWSAQVFEIDDDGPQIDVSLPASDGA